eukprot:scaffold20706_cov18-Tisochrysis_lutea.AAC.3
MVGELALKIKRLVFQIGMNQICAGCACVFTLFCLSSLSKQLHLIRLQLLHYTHTPAVIACPAGEATEWTQPAEHVPQAPGLLPLVTALLIGGSGRKQEVLGRTQPEPRLQPPGGQPQEGWHGH